MQSFINASLFVAIAFGAYADYDTTDNGATWPGTCATGTEQSPIDLPNYGSYWVDGIAVILGDYGVTTEVASENDFANTIAIPDQNARMTIVDPDGNNKPPYKPLQFHFHYPSEHTIDGELLDAEMHIVHQNDDGDLAVLGIFFEIGTENAFIKSVLEN